MVQRLPNSRRKKLQSLRFLKTDINNTLFKLSAYLKYGIFSMSNFSIFPLATALFKMYVQNEKVNKYTFYKKLKMSLLLRLFLSIMLLVSILHQYGPDVQSKIKMHNLLQLCLINIILK